MSNQAINVTDVKQQLVKMKNKKAPGPNGLKIELFKGMTKCSVPEYISYMYEHHLAQCTYDYNMEKKLRFHANSTTEYI